MNRIILIAPLLIFLTLSACTNINKSQVSVDIRACNDLSYNNDQVDLKAMDVIFNQCMDKKRKMRKKEQKHARNEAILGFVINMFALNDN